MKKESPSDKIFSNFETLADLQNGMVNQTQKNVGYVNIAVRTIL